MITDHKTQRTRRTHWAVITNSKAMPTIFSSSRI